MPYTVTKSDKCPASKPWACVKKTDGKVMGCHKTKADALDQLAALMANEGEEKMSDERAAQGGKNGAELRYAIAPVTHVDVRDPQATEDGCWTMSGYASVFNQETTLLDSRFIKVTEEVDAAAFDEVLSEQPMDQPDGVVHFNFGHDMNRAVAATDVPAGQEGALQLRADEHGLHFLAKVPRDDPDGVAMAVKMRSGVLRQASFAFTVAEDEFIVTESDDEPTREHRIIKRIGHLYDVCAVPQGAYSQTVSNLRSYAAALGQPHGYDPERDIALANFTWGGRPRQPEAERDKPAEAAVELEELEPDGGASVVSPDTGGDGGESGDAAAVRAAILQKLEEDKDKLNG